MPEAHKAERLPRTDSAGSQITRFRQVLRLPSPNAGAESRLKIRMPVVETPPEMKGATASNSPKPAKLETGLTVQVPAFVKEGDRVRVDTESGAYLERVR